MKKSFFFIAILLLIAGCASSNRMFRMSGGVLDEYSAPKKVHIRSEKYQQISRNISSAARANKIKVAGMDDILVNIWPFFFRSNDYWSVLWPMVDKDPFGFAFRPFYNHEGDDYSILFPLSAWNPAKKHGWVTLFGWNENGCGVIPLTWQWRNGKSGGAYYTPLLFWSYDHNPLHYTLHPNGTVTRNWSREDQETFAFLTYYAKHTRVDRGKWSWLYNIWWRNDPRSDAVQLLAEQRNIWNYYFKGRKPFPETKKELEKFRAEIFKSLPRTERKSYGFLPFWLGSFDNNGNFSNRFLLLTGNEKQDNYYTFDILGPVLGRYRKNRYPGDRWLKGRTSFTSWLLLSHFYREENYLKSGKWEIFNQLYSRPVNESFARRKPVIKALLKQLDPALDLPAEVVDHVTLDLYLDELFSKYDLPTGNVYGGRIVPLFWYRKNPEHNYRSNVLPLLLTWWGQEDNRSYFTSLPLLTFITRSKSMDKTIVMTPLVYYAKSYHRDRGDYPVFTRDKQKTQEYQCAELRDQYAACGLFYRGKFGFNVVKKNIDARTVEKLRIALKSLHLTGSDLVGRLANIEEKTRINDQWQTTTEIDRLKKLIRYEELKIYRADWLIEQAKYRAKVDEAVKCSQQIGLPMDQSVFGDRKKSAAALAELMEKYTELRYYEDIGNGIFFRKEKFYNGDNNWHFLRIAAGGEKSGGRESTHILHLLYRYRKEGQRSERIFFPFISAVQDGDDSKISFMWRLFSLSRRQGKIGGHILFIPFGSEW